MSSTNASSSEDTKGYANRSKWDDEESESSGQISSSSLDVPG